MGDALGHAVLEVAVRVGRRGLGLHADRQQLVGAGRRRLAGQDLLQFAQAIDFRLRAGQAQHDRDVDEFGGQQANQDQGQQRHQQRRLASGSRGGGHLHVTGASRM